MAAGATTTVGDWGDVTHELIQELLEARDDPTGGGAEGGKAAVYCWAGGGVSGAAGRNAARLILRREYSR